MIGGLLIIYGVICLYMILEILVKLLAGDLD